MAFIKHTPGPYRIAGESVAGRYITIKAATGRIVARVPFSSPAQGDKGIATDHYDAVLLAATPEMLAALEEALVVLQDAAAADPTWSQAALARDLVARVIAKATA